MYALMFNNYSNAFKVYSIDCNYLIITMLSPQTSLYEIWGLYCLYHYMRPSKYRNVKINIGGWE